MREREERKTEEEGGREKEKERVRERERGANRDKKQPSQEHASPFGQDPSTLESQLKGVTELGG